MRGVRLAGFLAAGLLAATSTANAGDSDAQFVVDLGVGGMAQPTYPGADSYIFVPYPIVEFGRFYLPVVGQRQAVTSGFFLYPSLAFNGERKSSDDASLAGTKEIPWVLEAGLGAGYRGEHFRAFVDVRQTFNTDAGQVGDFGIDYLTPVTPRIALAIGPRVSVASQDYMRTYFGVTRAEAARGPLAAYKPGGGFESVGLAAKVTYALTERTSIELKGSWDHFVGDAADSPIVKAGSADQWMVGLGISHRFAFDLFRR